MQRLKGFKKCIILLSLIYLAGCAGRSTHTSSQGEYVEIKNPAFTSSPNAPEMIWVPRSSVETGVARGSEVVKRGYEAVTGKDAPTAKAAPSAQPAPIAGPGSTPAQWIPVAPPTQQSVIAGPGGAPAQVIPHFGLVVAVDGSKVYFNLGKETGIKPGQHLRIYRGGTIIEGLGLAPGERVATVEVIDFVGTKGGYATIKQGGPVQKNDLIGAE